MKKILITLITIAAIALPVSVFAGTSFSFGMSSYGHGSSIGFHVESHSGYHYRGSRVRVVAPPRGTVIIRERTTTVYERYPHHRSHPGSYVHRQPGRVYYEEPYDDRRVIVVPRGSRYYHHRY